MKYHPFPLLLCLLSVAFVNGPVFGAPPSVKTGSPAVSDAVLLSRLTPNSRMSGFRTSALYLNANDRPMGARFVHEKTGFTLDVLRIQTAPQMFLWVNTPPTSDKGEPHTQEHLLLGKGNRGRYVGSLEGMSLAGSNAFTMQWRTCYNAYTEAGSGVFFRLLESQMDALLHPDYTDEEVRREVRNWGVTTAADGKLQLEEKGTVYNEMVNTTARPDSRLYQAVIKTVYGKNHPLSYNSGGTPEALRTLTPNDIRAFRNRNYYLSNMGMIAAWPREMPLSQSLTQMSGLLNRLKKNAAPAGKRGESTIPTFPAPRPSPDGSVFSVPYPDNNAQQPGAVFFVWPANRTLDARGETLLSLFLDSVAGEPDTNLYKRFIDRKTRKRDTGAQSLFGWMDSNSGHPVYIGLNGVPPSHRTETEMRAVRTEIRDELGRIAAYRDGSKELAAFNQRVRSRLLQRRRDLSKFVSSPPGFGFRETGDSWVNHLLLLERKGGFRRSVTLKSEQAAIEMLLGQKRNIWRDYLASWHLLKDIPYAATTRPVPALIARDATERRARADAEIAILKKRFGTSDAQDAIRRYKAEYDANTARLEAAEKGVPALRFVENPPLTSDDSLDYQVTRLRETVPVVSSTFEDMTGASAGLALRLDGVLPESRFLLSALPSLLSRAGVIRNGVPLSYERVLDLQRREVLSVGANYSINHATRRCELVVSGAGNDAAESRNAVGWMRLLLLHPDWRKENLPRLRDLVDQQLAEYRGRMKGSEETWVDSVSHAYYRQDDPILLCTDSFLTAVHDAHRLRWRLMNASPLERSEVAAFLTGFAVSPGDKPDRARLRSALALITGKKADAASARLSPGARRLIAEAAKDLELTLPDIPDDSLGLDWGYLCREMAADLLTGPDKTLAQLDTLRRGLLQTGGARGYVIGSRAVQKSVSLPFADLVRQLAVTAPLPLPRDGEGTAAITSRLQEREPDAVQPMYVGLVAPDMASGVFLNSAPGSSLRDTDPESVLRFLAFNLYAGGGGDGVFMKTWSAGLAYSNGLRADTLGGRISYYAERTPELPQTLSFVINLLKTAPHNPRLAEYTIASAFDGGRSASPYESRGIAMADNIADGINSEKVRQWRKAVLSVRNRPDLSEALYARMPGEVSKVLPGFDESAKDVPGAVYFVIGAEKQLTAYEAYLKGTKATDKRVHRLYPRDFWLPLSEALTK